jgi:hypothetical protein
MVLKMRRNYKLLYFISFLLLLTSCENEIKVSVKPGPERLVVDAFVNNFYEKQYIRLSKSIPYFNTPGTEPGVSGALVAIADTTGGNTKLFVFADSGSGKYVFQPNKATGDTFTMGHQYILLIVEGTDTLISMSKLNATAKIDSIKVNYENGQGLRFKPGNYVELIAKDLKGLGNTYWIKTYRNDSFLSRINDLNLAYDMTQTQNGSQDGGLFIWPIRIGALNNFRRPWLSGEKIKVEVLSITYETFAFMNEVINENSNGGLFSTPPINIFTNIFNLNPKKTRALGGFFCMSAGSRIQKTMP